MKDKKFDLSVILACYNEMQIINDSVPKIIEFLDNTCLNYEIIMIDDCSKDGTREEIPKLAKKYPQIRYLLHEKNLGRGGTVSQGIKMAKGKIAGFLDIDLETPQWYILPAYIELKKGYDILSAHRIYKFNFKKLIRVILSRGYNILMKNTLKIPFVDTEAGFKFFNRERIIPVLDEIKDTRWFWDTEIMARAYYKRYKIKEMPTLFVAKNYKTSTVKLFQDSLDYFKRLMKFKKETKRLRRKWD